MLLSQENGRLHSRACWHPGMQCYGCPCFFVHMHYENPYLLDYLLFIWEAVYTWESIGGFWVREREQNERKRERFILQYSEALLALSIAHACSGVWNHRVSCHQVVLSHNPKQGALGRLRWISDPDQLAYCKEPPLPYTQSASVHCHVYGGQGRGFARSFCPYPTTKGEKHGADLYLERERDPCSTAPSFTDEHLF